MFLNLKYFTILPKKSQYFFKGRKFKVQVIEKTTKEKLIEFIHNLTDEEVKIIISYLQNEKEQS